MARVLTGPWCPGRLCAQALTGGVGRCVCITRERGAVQGLGRLGLRAKTRRVPSLHESPTFGSSASTFASSGWGRPRPDARRCCWARREPLQASPVVRAGPVAGSRQQLLCQGHPCHFRAWPPTPVPSCPRSASPPARGLQGRGVEGAEGLRASSRRRPGVRGQLLARWGWPQPRGKSPRQILHVPPGFEDARGGGGHEDPGTVAVG